MFVNVDKSFKTVDCKIAERVTDRKAACQPRHDLAGHGVFLLE